MLAHTCVIRDGRQDRLKFHGGNFLIGEMLLAKAFAALPREGQYPGTLLTDLSASCFLANLVGKLASRRLGVLRLL